MDLGHQGKVGLDRRLVEPEISIKNAMETLRPLRNPWRTLRFKICPCQLSAEIRI